MDNSAKSAGYANFEDALFQSEHLTASYDGNGRMTAYKNGEAIDIVKYDSQLDAISSFVADALLIEAPLMLGKFISNLSKGGSDDAIETAVKVADGVEDASGTANIYKYEGTADNPFGHYKVETSFDGTTLTTDQVITSSDLSTTTIRATNGNNASVVAKVDLPNAKAAQGY
ncbi:hypothetical protein [Winogradskyella luteola]|uniref:Uncharacterized protein n=1 Tax=Winogradskyella luteola TaxID=2828330 RepID=A0A9X1FBY8_9FLAO|nr:hypothetical protein [Winogradskyella luteola]MBV7270168.1 hypothetical protein [Winogradskyella luteola]